MIETSIIIGIFTIFFGLLLWVITNSQTNIMKNMDDMNENLSKRMDDTNENLSKRMDDMNENLSKRMDDMNENLSKRMDDNYALLLILVENK